MTSAPTPTTEDAFEAGRELSRVRLAEKLKTRGKDEAAK